MKIPDWKQKQPIRHLIVKINGLSHHTSTTPRFAMYITAISIAINPWFCNVDCMTLWRIISSNCLNCQVMLYYLTYVIYLNYVQLTQSLTYLFVFFWWTRATDLSCRASRSAKHRLFKSSRVAGVLGIWTAVPLSNSSWTTVITLFYTVGLKVVLLI